MSANLASAIAQLGHKVLLIDGDFHKPRQHSIWDLNNNVGLIEVLQGKADLSQAIQPLQCNPFLDVLPAGLSHAEYLSLLKSEKMSELIALCREKYDRVIIDTPPVLLFADTLAISKNTDGIILVARLGVTNPTTANNAKELLMQSKQKVLGVAVNGVDSEPENYYIYAKDYDSRIKTTIIF